MWCHCGVSSVFVGSLCGFCWVSGSVWGVSGFPGSLGSLGGPLGSLESSGSFGLWCLEGFWMWVVGSERLEGS